MEKLNLEAQDYLTRAVDAAVTQASRWQNLARFALLHATAGVVVAGTVIWHGAHAPCLLLVPVTALYGLMCVACRNRHRLWRARLHHAQRALVETPERREWHVEQMILCGQELRHAPRILRKPGEKHVDSP